MRIGTWAAAAVLAAAAAGCGRFGGGGDGGSAGEQHDPEAVQEDSARATAKALQDSGVTVDTQTIDTGTARTTPAEDN